MIPRLPQLTPRQKRLLQKALKSRQLIMTLVADLVHMLQLPRCITLARIQVRYSNKRNVGMPRQSPRREKSRT